MDYNHRKTNLLIGVIFLAVVLGVILTLAILYNTALNEERMRLRETAESQASLLDAVARFDLVYSSDYPGGSTAATLSQMQDAHSQYEGFGNTGEFTLAKEEDGMIVFLLSHRHGDSSNPEPIPMDSSLAEPMRRALMGNSGTIIGLDYRGETVLAAYKPVPNLDMGIVAKIDLAEIQAPYIQAGVYVSIVALGIAIIAAFISRRMTSSLEHQVIKSEELYRTLVQTMNDGLVMKDSQGKITFANNSFCSMLNFPVEQIVGRMITDFLDEKNTQIFIKNSSLQNHDNKVVYELELIGKNHRKIPTIVSSRKQVDSSGKLQGTIAVITNISDRVEKERQLREAAHRWQSTFNSINDSLCLVDLEGQLQRCNQTALKLLGKTAEEVTGKLCWEVFYGTPEAPKDCPHSEMISTQKRASSEVNLLNRWFNVVVDPVFDEQNVLIGGVHAMYDITEQKRARENVQRQLERISSLHEIDRAIISSLDIDLTLNIVLDNLIKRLGADAGNILLLNMANQLVHGASRGLYDLGVEKNVRLRVGEGLAGKVGLERKSMYIPDVREQNGDNLQLDFIDRENIIAYFAVPLVAKGNLLGVIEVFHRSRLEPDNEWLSYLETLAGQASIAIHNAMLFNDLEKANVNLELSYIKTLEGWVKALDLRDHETEGHTQRVSQTTLQLATHLGIPAHELIDYSRGALLHDIGKMAIPDSILHKPGPLTDKEWEIMHLHPVYAYQFISEIEYLRKAVDIPYCHHERWDGTGYPRGLKGEDIPFSARVFAVVDVWDALLSDRPYRKAWDEEKVLEYIQQESGTHFDPQVVTAFLAMIKNNQLHAE